MSSTSPFRHDDRYGSPSSHGDHHASENGAAGTNGAASGSTNGQASRVEELEFRVKRLSLVCEAMWDLLGQEVGLGLDQLADRVEQLAARSSQRAEPEPEPGVCPDCGERMPPEAKVCLFCSARGPGQDRYG